ncbi:sulfotransferase family protein [Constantimarinum furrinae]|uniref:Sulfotransferase family protein n=1 Tax=Constantimarinum furrinae TaxID=2562285 RepID=A0A7G8PX86_9FLAO|nr:sulfotransferase [Constantimarinum furrinae]QNJ98952.1 Sulfotransferase family protein [Constantimarinum furrinae]
MSSERKANLFVVGAMRSGTTSFSEVLSKHPQIYFSPIKEPNYFVDSLPKALYEPSRFFDLETYFDKKFPSPKHIAHIENPIHYQTLFSQAAEQHIYVAEASTAYLHAPDTARRIYEYNPNATIVIILRDPLERAYSHYRMDLGLGREKQSFEHCMTTQLKLQRSGDLPWYTYLNMSFYDSVIEKYSALFKTVICVRFEDMIDNTDSFLANLSAELKISPFGYYLFDKNNAAQTPRFKSMWYWGRRLGLKAPFSYLFPSKLKQGIFQKLSRTDRSHLEISNPLFEELNEVFKKQSLNYYKSV